MSRIPVLVMSVVLLAGCTSMPEIVRFEDSNAYIVQESIEQIPITDSLRTVLDKEDRVVLVSIEDDVTDDTAITSMLEDVFLRKLVMGGYQVLERDEDLLYRLMSECDSTYVHRYANRKRILSSQRVSGFIAPYPMDLVYSSRSQVGTYSEVVKAEESGTPSRLLPADKLVAYRVLESGVVYREGKSKTESSPIMKRTARTILNVRVEDTETGRILKMFPIEGVAEDEMPSSLRELLQEFHFRHYSFGYPKVYGNPEQIEFMSSEHGEPRRKNCRELVVWGA